MNTKFGILFVISCLYLLSCRHAEKTTQDVDNVVDIVDIEKLTQIADNGEFAPLYESVDFITLPQTEDFLVGDIQKVAESDSSYYIFFTYDNGDQGRVAVTDLQGNYKNDISRRGNGPGEYVRLEAFAMTDSILFLQDGYRGHILRFGKNNNYIDEAHIPDIISTYDIAALDDENALIRGMVYNYNKSIYSILNIKTGESEALLSNPFDLSKHFAFGTAAGALIVDKDSTLLLAMPFSSTVQALNASTHELTPYLTVLTGAEPPQPSPGENFDEFEAKLDRNTELFGRPFTIFKSGDWSVINFLIATIVWNNSTKSGFYTKNKGWSEATKAFPFAPQDIVGVAKDGSFICSMSAEDLLELAETADLDGPFMPTRKLFENLTEDSNPVLIRYKFKQ